MCEGITRVFQEFRVGTPASKWFHEVVLVIVRQAWYQFSIGGESKAVASLAEAMTDGVDDPNRSACTGDSEVPGGRFRRIFKRDELRPGRL